MWIGRINTEGTTNQQIDSARSKTSFCAEFLK